MQTASLYQGATCKDYSRNYWTIHIMIQYRFVGLPGKRETECRPLTLWLEACAASMDISVILETVPKSLATKPCQRRPSCSAEVPLHDRWILLVPNPWACHCHRCPECLILWVGNMMVRTTHFHPGGWEMLGDKSFLVVSPNPLLRHRLRLVLREPCKASLRKFSKKAHNLQQFVHALPPLETLSVNIIFILCSTVDLNKMPNSNGFE